MILPDAALIRVDSNVVIEPYVVASLWARVEKTETCWLWKGYLRNGTHGAIEHHGRLIYVHRISWAIHFGPIPDGMLVCHECDIGNCIKPDDLFLGDDLANVRDMWRKGRARPGHAFKGGAGNVNARLTDEQVAELRRRWMADPVDQRALAAAFGVSQSTVWRLVNGIVRQEASDV